MADETHCTFCFDVIVEKLDGLHTYNVPRFSNDQFPLFVTFNINESKDSDPDWQLRGCIGTFSPKNLLEGLREYALISAFEDSRFPPISQKELSMLKCCVSLLINFEDAKDYKDWQVGIHGISIDFTGNRGKSYTATYLPEVASEQGWDQERAIRELISKAGYRRNVSTSFLRTVKVTRYQSSKFALTYQQWQSIKNHRRVISIPKNISPTVSHQLPRPNGTTPSQQLSRSNGRNRPARQCTQHKPYQRSVNSGKRNGVPFSSYDRFAQRTHNAYSPVTTDPRHHTRYNAYPNGRTQYRRFNHHHHHHGNGNFFQYRHPTPTRTHHQSNKNQW